MERLPDIVLVVFDTARRDRFGCYGYPKPTTPAVDRLAAEGMRVDTMVTNGPYTMPSHGSLFTGLYPTQHGSQWQSGPSVRDSVEVTMAEWLRDLGYTTVCATTNELISPGKGLARGFDRYAGISGLRGDRGSLVRRAVRRFRRGIAGRDSGGKTLNQWVREELPEIDGPLFLFVNYLECHWAYVPPRRFERRVGGPRFGPLEGFWYRARVASRVGPWEAVANADERKLDIYSSLYDGELANADNHLAELLDMLAANGRMEDGRSVVMVTSDHGEHIGERGLADHHAALDDLLIRVPFVAWGPGIVPTGVQRNIYEFVDVMPSLASVLHVPVPAGYLDDRRTDLFTLNPVRSGDSAFAEWRAWTPKEQTRLAARNPSYDFTGLARDLVCLRDDRFKLVRGSDGMTVLYDLDADPSEETDVSSTHPEVVSAMSIKLDEAIAKWRPWDGEASPLSEDEAQEIERHLSALGYI